MKIVAKGWQAARNWGPMMLIVFGSLWLLQAALAHAPGHGVIVLGTQYDAGTVKAGAVISHSIRVINLSAQPVEVDAQPSCGCTAIDVPMGAIIPLHIGIVTVQVDTDGMKLISQHKMVTLHLASTNRDWQQSILIQFRLQQEREN